MYAIYPVAEGIIRVTSAAYGAQIWALAGSGSKKIQWCEKCRREMPIGSQLYRPLGNPSNRSHRICTDCGSCT